MRRYVQVVLVSMRQLNNPNNVKTVVNSDTYNKHMLNMCYTNNYTNSVIDISLAS